MGKDAFAEVRSFMNRPKLSALDWYALKQLLVEAHQANPARYAAQWRPYLDGFRHHFEEHFDKNFLDITYLPDVKELLELYPFVLVRSEFTVSKTRILYNELERESFRWVGQLVLHMHTKLPAKAITSISTSPNAVNLREIELDLSDNHSVLDERTCRALPSLFTLPKLHTFTLVGATLLDANALASPELESLETLRLLDTITEDQLPQLLDSPHVSKLRELVIHGGIHSMSALPFAHATQLEALEALELRGAQRSWTKRPAGIRDEGCQALAGAKHLATLKSLTLIQQEITDEGARSLIQSPHLTSLTHLDLGHNAIGDAGAAAIANASNTRTLTHLDLSQNMLIGATGLRALARSEHFIALKKIILEGLRVDATSQVVLQSALGARFGCEIHAAPSALRQTDAPELVRELEEHPLEHLALNIEAPGSETLRTIIDADVLDDVKHLALSGDVDDEDIVALADAGGLEGLRTLSLSRTQAGDRALRAILAHPHTMSLHTLNLAATRISERGLRALAMAETLTSLRTLVLPMLSFELVEMIARTSWAKQLEHFGSSSPLDENTCARLLELEDLPDAISECVEENIRYHAG